jgi:predicted membrane-bound mannosyltransferase
MTDHDLQSRFDELRSRDERAAAPFDAVLARPRARVRRRGTFVAVLAAAAVIVIAICLRFFTPVASVPSIVSWESPTAMLLETPGQELLRSTPTVRSSLLSGVPLD